MNTGIQDAHNLAWKLASVLKGISPYSLIQSYEMERRPVLICLIFSLYLHPSFYLTSNASQCQFLDHLQIAIFNTALSVQNFSAAMEVPAALGLDPSVANSGK